MESPVLDMGNQNGRVNFGQIVQFAHRNPERTFVSYCVRPFLIGKGLLEGELVQEPGIGATQTMSFDTEALFEDVDKQRRSASNTIDPASNTMARAIFTFQKPPNAETPRNVFTLGRVAENDIVVADYSVSKWHAEIIMKQGSMFYITDCGSTNGTIVSGKAVAKGARTRLKVGDEIVMGRLEFVFVDGERLYRVLTKSR
jgi:hypothetical protein